MDFVSGAVNAIELERKREARREELEHRSFLNRKRVISDKHRAAAEKAAILRVSRLRNIQYG